MCSLELKLPKNGKATTSGSSNSGSTGKTSSGRTLPKNTVTKTCGKETLDYLLSSSLFKDDDLDSRRDLTDCKINQFWNNQEWKVTADTNEDGTMEEVNLSDAIADSFDSELDLYIQDEFQKILKKYGTKMKGFLCPEAIAELKAKGIQVDSVGDADADIQFSKRVYSFSLVDKDGNVLVDENGKKGSILFADCIIPDGYAQGAEVNLSSILDVMGKDCLSKADFIGHEDEYYKLLEEVGANVQAGKYGSSGKINDIYGKTMDIQTAWEAIGKAGASALGMQSGEGSYAGTDGKVQFYSYDEATIAAEKAEAEALEKADKLKETGTPTAEEQKNYDNAKKLYTARSAKLKAAYKNENGVEAKGSDLREIEAKAKDYIRSEFGDDAVDVVDD